MRVCDASDRLEKAVSDIEPLILDLLEWLDKEPRPYLDVMEAWRTSCPRLPVWEESVDRGFVGRERRAEQDATVRLTSEGRDYLLRKRPPSGTAGMTPVHAARERRTRELVGA